MSAIRTLVCDDEPLANERLTSMLARIKDVIVVGTASSGGECLALAAELRPELLLVDIEMPDMDGFDVVERLCSGDGVLSEAPLVAFVTAFRRFAPDAFDSGAIDFLTKPVRIARLERTIDRAAQAIAGREARRRLVALQTTLDELRGEQHPFRNAHAWVQRHGEQVRIELNEVDWVAAEGAYIRLHVGATSYLHREAIGSIERRLDPAKFVRVHRSHLVRTSNVAAIRRTVHGGGELTLRSGERIPLGRKYASEARRRLLDAGSGR